MIQQRLSTQIPKDTVTVQTSPKIALSRLPTPHTYSKNDSIVGLLDKISNIGGSCLSFIVIIDENHLKILYQSDNNPNEFNDIFKDFVKKIDISRNKSNPLINSVIKSENYSSNDLTNIFSSISPHSKVTSSNQLQGSIQNIPFIFESKNKCSLVIMSEKYINSNISLLIENLIDHIKLLIERKFFQKLIQNQQEEIELYKKQINIISTYSSSISHVLNPHDISNNALNLATNLLGKDVLGIMYFLYDEASNTLVLDKFTDTLSAHPLLPIIDITSKAYRIDLINDLNSSKLNTKAFQQNNPILSPKLSDLLYPQVPIETCKQIQNILKIKTILAVPISSGSKTTSIVNFLIRNKSPRQISDIELETIAIISKQMSTVLENMYLFHQTSLTLNSLQEINKRDKDMLDILGHELRTPVTVCKGNLEIILKRASEGDINLDSYTTQKLNMAIESIKKESGLINELLSATKIESGQLVMLNESVNLNEVTEYSYLTHQDIAQKQNLTLNYSRKEIPKIIGDGLRLGEVIDNLISNAIKYTRSGEINIKLDYDEELIYFHVKDTGNGIPQEEIPNLFKKFYRLNNHLDDENKIIRPGGTGLGLYVAKGIIDAHGGTIWVESEGEGRGSTFSFSIPIKNNQHIDEGSDMFLKLNLTPKDI